MNYKLLYVINNSFLRYIICFKHLSFEIIKIGILFILFFQLNIFLLNYWKNIIFCQYYFIINIFFKYYIVSFSVIVYNALY